MTKKARIPQGLMYAFAKDYLGRSLHQQESLVEICVKGLIAKGCVPKSPNVGHKSARSFMADHIDVLRGTPRIQKTPKSKTVERPQPIPSVASDAFLSTYEWRRVRMQALKKYGARCQCCGATPASGAVMNVDHIKPRKIFPELALSLENLQVLCHECNHGKGNWDMTDWRGEIAEVP